MRLFFVGALLLASVVAAQAQDAPSPGLKTVEPIDYLVRPRNYLGQWVQIGRCVVAGATSEGAGCVFLAPGAKMTMAAAIGSIGLEGATLNPPDFRRALQQCTGYELSDPACAVSVSGVVVDRIGEMTGSQTSTDLWLRNGSINWPDQ